MAITRAPWRPLLLLPRPESRAAHSPGIFIALQFRAHVTARDFFPDKSFDSSKSFGHDKNSGPKTFRSNKSFDPDKNFGPDKNSGPKTFRSNKSFGSDKNSDPKTFRYNKSFNSEKGSGSNKSFGPNKSSRPKKDSGPNKSLGPKLVRRFIPADVAGFMRQDGKLLTDQPGRDFLVKYGIEPDNGRMVRLQGDWELSSVQKDYAVQLGYSPRHVLNPFDLRYFQPRGHPLIPKIKADYARMTQERPLWIFATVSGGASAVVRNVMQRKLTRAVYEALDKIGYHPSMPGGSSPEGARIRGTLWISIFDPCKAATQSRERFGTVVAGALAAHCKRQFA
ncbi:hypothetical protein E4U31_003723 [Claviceps sp. LM219 group G6]|nr:hypothetical protein E4U15_007410 [Claviceps sp. LM218 group G6]KAG6101305.1 hypothetical protein E4U31_003723 [Claviceps sp. LM219 group G6]